MERTDILNNSTVQIMLVEDDRILAREIKLFLEKWNYHVILTENFKEVAELCRLREPRLILMDINLPYYDGFYWCRKIRGFSEVPILYISSRNDDGDKLQAYAQGGDDYIEKPFHMDIMRAKIEAVLRRTYHNQVTDRIHLTQKVSFDTDSKELYVENLPVELTRSERRILGKLVESRGKVVSREELMIELWNTDEFVSDGTLTTLVSRLRSRLSECCGEEFIKTRKGQGYYSPVGRIII